MKQEEKMLKEHITKSNMRITRQRETILKTFLNTESHVSVGELYKEISKRDPSIGLATIYRTINLLCECGLAQQREFGDGETRYEHYFNHRHHDHLVCTRCGKIEEFENTEIERLQARVAKSHRFEAYTHKLELYGLCASCKQ